MHKYLPSSYLRKTDINPTDSSTIRIKPALTTHTEKAFAKIHATGTAFILVLSVSNIRTSEDCCIFVNDQVKPNSWQLRVPAGSLIYEALLQNAPPGYPPPLRDLFAFLFVENFLFSMFS